VSANSTRTGCRPPSGPVRRSRGGTIKKSRVGRVFEAHHFFPGAWGVSKTRPTPFLSWSKTAGAFPAAHGGSRCSGGAPVFGRLGRKGGGDVPDHHLFPLGGDGLDRRGLHHEREAADAHTIGRMQRSRLDTLIVYEHAIQAAAILHPPGAEA